MSQANMSSSPCLSLAFGPGKMHGTKQSDSLFFNMLLEDFVSISNLTAVFALN
jgi:hypothetical protein